MKTKQMKREECVILVSFVFLLPNGLSGEIPEAETVVEEADGGEAVEEAVEED
jgi:hypothetical protein